MAIILLVLLNVLIMLLFLRVLIQLSAISPSNAVVQSSVKATKALDLLNQGLPNIAGGRINLAGLILLPILFLLKVWVASYFGIGVDLFGRVYKALASEPLSLILGTLMAITDGVIMFCRYLIFATIVMSLISMVTQNRGPFSEAIQELAEPLFAPFRKLLPNMGMFDLSPLFAILVLILAENIMSMITVTLLSAFR